MANLIIKPTSGGSLILQDEGGDAALTVSAAGNVQAATTLGVTGASTMTGNVTMAGTANNLGTSTAGTLTSGVTFPGAAGTNTAGHVVAVKYHSDNTSYTIDGAGNTDCPNYNMVYTPASATNRLLIQMSVYMWVSDENTTNNHEAQGSAWIRDVTNGTNLWHCGMVVMYESQATTTQQLRSTATSMFCHVPTLSSGSITYSLRLAGAGSNDAYIDQIAAYRTDTRKFTGTITEFKV